MPPAQRKQGHRIKDCLCANCCYWYAQTFEDSRDNWIGEYERNRRFAR